MLARFCVLFLVAVSMAGCMTDESAMTPRMSVAQLTAELGKPSEERSYADGSRILTYQDVNYRKLFPGFAKYKGQMSLTFEFDKSGLCTLTGQGWKTSSNGSSGPPLDGSFAQELTNLNMSLTKPGGKFGPCGFSQDGTGQVSLSETKDAGSR